MCPMRFVLVFFSAVLAGYLAWRTASSVNQANLNIGEDAMIEDNAAQNQNKKLDWVKLIKNGFLGFVDMASGRYLWRNLNKIKGEVKEMQGDQQLID